MNGQTIVFWLLVTNTITILVSFAFYMPDPVLSGWKKNDNWDRGQKKSVERYFNFTNKGVNQIICIRGEKKIRAMVSSARLKVDAHSVKIRRPQSW